MTTQGATSANRRTTIQSEHKAIVDAFDKATEALRIAAQPLLKLDASKVEDSKVKFLIIRAKRADHLARESADRQSYRQ